MKLISNPRNLLKKFFFSNEEKKEVLSVNDTPLDAETLTRLSFYFNHLDHSKNKNEQVSIEPPSKKNLLLADIFESPEKYEYIMSILVKKKFCAPVTYFWIDYKKGYKGSIIGLLNSLQVQGYFKGYKKLTHCQLREISLNSFGVDISLDLIKHVDFQHVDVSFIPPNSF